MSEWKEIRIGDMAEFNISSIKGNFNCDLIEYIDTSSVEKGSLIQTQIIPLQEAPSRAKRRIKKNDILISTVRPNLKHYYFVHDCQENTIVSTGFVVITPKEEVEPYFLYCLLTTPSYTYYLTQIANSHTSTYPSFNPDIIKNSIRLIPKYSEQFEISKIIKTLDNKIDLLRRQNETLEAIAQTMFKRWFVEFEFPDENGLPYKSSGGKMVSSELGVIPEGWSIGEIGNELKIAYGKNLPTKYLKEHGYPVFGGNGIIGFYDKYIYKEPQVLVSCRGEASGKINCSLPYSYVTNNSLILEMPAKSVITFSYLKHFCLRQNLRPYVTGSAQPQVTIDSLTICPILIPGKNIIDNFSFILNKIERKILSNNKQNKALIRTRDTLLPKLMSGQIRVKEN